MLKTITGAKHAIATSSGTTTLHWLWWCGSWGRDGSDDASSSFVATANAISYCRAVPHFVDISPKTLGIDLGLCVPAAEIAKVTKKDALTGRRVVLLKLLFLFIHLVIPVNWTQF